MKIMNQAVSIFLFLSMGINISNSGIVISDKKEDEMIMEFLHALNQMD